MSGRADDRYEVATAAAAARGLALVALQPTSDGGLLFTFGRHDPLPPNVETGPFVLEMVNVCLSPREVQERHFWEVASVAADRAERRLYVREEDMQFVRPMGAVS